MKHLKKFRIALVTAAALVAAGSALAADKLTIIVPFAAGGPTDMIANAFAKAAKKHLRDQDVVIENVGGGGGTVGAERAARANPDGTTVFLHNIALGTAPALNAELKYNAMSDFEYVGLFEEVPMALVGRTSLPTGFTDLRYWVDGKREAITLAHAGTGSASHLCGLLLESAMKVKTTHKTYKGNGPAMVDVISGNVDLLCDAVVSATPQIEAGKVKAYGVTAAGRLGAPALNQVPAMSELGMPGAQFNIWFGLSAPKGTPSSVLRKLNAMVKAVTADPEFIQSQVSAGATIVNDDRLNPGAHRRFVEAQINHWTTIIRSAEAKSDSKVGVVAATKPAGGS